LINHKAHLKLHKLQIVEPLEQADFNTPRWYAQQFGAAVGMLPSYLLMNACVGQVANRLSRTFAGAESVYLLGMRFSKNGFNIAKSAFSGAAYEGICKPTELTKDSFELARAKNALIGAITFGSISATHSILTRLAGGELASQSLKDVPLKLLTASASGSTGGLFNAEAQALLKSWHRKPGESVWQAMQSLHLANGKDTWQSMYGFGVIGAGIGTFHLASPFLSRALKARINSGRVESNRSNELENSDTGERKATSDIADAESPVKPASTEARDSLLKSGELRYLGERKIDELGHVVKLAEVKDRDGRSTEVVVHRLDGNDSWAVSKLYKAEIAQDLNSRMDLTNGVPSTAERTLEIDGVPQKVWIEELAGKNINDGLPELAEQQSGNCTEEAVLDLLRKDSELSGQLEQALAERIMNGDGDINPFNLVLSGRKIQNIDHTLSFPPQRTPSWTTNSMQGLMAVLRMEFAGKQLSPELSGRIDRFLARYDCEPGRTELEETGLKPEQIDGYLSRAQSLKANGFPPAWDFDCPEFFTYIEEADAARSYFDANPPNGDCRPLPKRSAARKI
jgi:hypothetical protein